MIELKQKLSFINNFIIDKNDVILVDYPLHHNVGDLIIFLGELEYFQENNINVKTHLSTYNTDISFLKKNISNNTTIICHGGGNFGDLYPVHQNLRESLIKQFPNNRIIVLPQTAYFSNESNKLKSQKIFNKHKDVIMFARDQETLNIFNDFSDHAFLMPDMAHALYQKIPITKNKQKKALYFLRKDIEKDESQISFEKSLREIQSYDWNDLLTSKDKLYANLIYKLARLNKKIFKSSYIDKIIFILWKKHSKFLVKKFSLYFSDFELVITSRLHGHILSCLVDTPSKLIDNSYGKNSGYYDLWTKQLPMTSLIEEK